MPIAAIERDRIVEKIDPIFEEVVSEYDFNKYPADRYERFKLAFSRLAVPNNDISDAMKWKWGHWGKDRFPERHVGLIAEIEIHWLDFIASESTDDPALTFGWWCDRFNRGSTYITTAYITDLSAFRRPPEAV